MTVERLSDAVHSHDIEDSFAIKLPTFIQRVVEGEAVKGYAAAQIFHALRGTAIAEGSQRLDRAGGSSLCLYSH